MSGRRTDAVLALSVMGVVLALLGSDVDERAAADIAPASHTVTWSAALPRPSEVARRTGVRVVTARAAHRGSWGTSWAPSRDVARLRESGNRLLRVLGSLPPSVIAGAGLRRIQLVEDLVTDGEPVAGLLDLAAATVILDTGLLTEHVVHHELFHALDLERADDPAWVAHRWPELDVPETLSTWWSLREIDWWHDLPPGVEGRALEPLGYATAYGATSPLEDRAELFAALMVREESDRLHARADGDTFLGLKLEAQKAQARGLHPDLERSWWRPVEPPDPAAWWPVR